VVVPCTENRWERRPRTDIWKERDLHSPIDLTKVQTPKPRIFLNQMKRRPSHVKLDVSSAQDASDVILSPFESPALLALISFPQTDMGRVQLELEDR
jgi:hypothetical protein